MCMTLELSSNNVPYVQIAKRSRDLAGQDNMESLSREGWVKKSCRRASIILLGNAPLNAYKNGSRTG